MIDSFEKEQFMHQPVFVTIEQNTTEAIGPRGDVVHPFAYEQNIVIHVGGSDYDVRDLVWRIFENESKINTLENQVDALVDAIKYLSTRLEVQEGRVY